MSDSVFSYGMLSAFVERAEDGKLDFDATVAKFAERLKGFAEATEKEDAAIGTAIHGVFDTKVSKGGALTMEAIVAFAIPSLNPNSENYKILADRIRGWVRMNSDRHEKKNKEGVVLVEAEAPRTRDFVIAKGKGGGCRRWADVPVKPEL